MVAHREDADNGSGLAGDWWLASNPADRLYYSGRFGGNGFTFDLYVNRAAQLAVQFRGSDRSPSELTGTLLDPWVIFGPAYNSPAHATK